MEAWKIIVTVAMKGKVMKEHYDSNGAGHFRVMKTQENLKASPLLLARNEEVSGLMDTEM